jgi:hypothetical protein
MPLSAAAQEQAGEQKVLDSARSVGKYEISDEIISRICG